MLGSFPSSVLLWHVRLTAAFPEVHSGGSFGPGDETDLGSNLASPPGGAGMRSQ